VARILCIIFLTGFLLLMLGAGICSGGMLIDSGPNGLRQDAEIVFVVAVPSSVVAYWVLVWLLHGKGKRPRVDASAHEGDDAVRR
jgi:hypothetical protein